jgi:hypothetical protein
MVRESKSRCTKPKDRSLVFVSPRLNKTGITIEPDMLCPFGMSGCEALARARRRGLRTTNPECQPNRGQTRSVNRSVLIGRCMT